MTQIHVIHENAAWLEPLVGALDRQRLPWRDWFLDHGIFDLSQPPPEGVFYNRMSASSHTRDHRYAAELTASVLGWLERHGRRTVNGSRALDLEISKARQYAALENSGIRTPRTVLVAGQELLVEAAQQHFGDIDGALKHRFEEFLARNDIGVAGIEFITDAAGAVYTYDVNTNTNYNPDAEARAGRSAMDILARYLGAELARLYPGRAAAA